VDLGERGICRIDGKEFTRSLVERKKIYFQNLERKTQGGFRRLDAISGTSIRIFK